MRQSLLALTLTLACVASHAEPPAASSLRDLVAQGYPFFTGAPSVALYEVQSGTVPTPQTYLAAEGNGPVNGPVSELVFKARNGDEFSKREALAALRQRYVELVGKARAAKGVLLRLRSSLGAYNFEAHAFPMHGEPQGGAPEKLFPGGAFCSEDVDALARNRRGYCLYPTNFSSGSYLLHIDDVNEARSFKSRWDQGSLGIYLVAELEGKIHAAPPHHSAAGVQGVRVVAVYAADGDGRVVLSMPVTDGRLAGVYEPGAQGAEAVRPLKSASRSAPALAPVPLRQVTKKPATPGKPVVVDIE